MNKRIYRWLLTGIFGCCLAGVQAQEPAVSAAKGWEIPGGGYIPQGITLPDAIPFAQWNRNTKIKPINWEQLLNEKVARERAWEQSVLISGQNSGAKQVAVRGNTATWNFRLGNGNASWSISTDHLDARRLMFPVPHGMAPNRPTGSRVAPNGQIKR